MKKTYINPTLEVVKIVSQAQMLAGSFTTDGDGNLTGGKLSSENATGAGLGRDDDFDWDD